MRPPPRSTPGTTRRSRTSAGPEACPTTRADVDFSPDGSWFAFVSTGFIPQAGGVGRDLCDATVRFETDVAVYVWGHQRWLNNPQGSNSTGPGAVSRPGIGAIHPTTSLACPGTPTKERGVGGKDLYVNSQGLRVGSDTNRIGGETRRRIALLPVP